MSSQSRMQMRGGPRADVEQRTTAGGELTPTLSAQLTSPSLSLSLNRRSSRSDWSGSYFYAILARLTGQVLISM